jgi:hypothetical protein
VSLLLLSAGCCDCRDDYTSKQVVKEEPEPEPEPVKHVPFDCCVDYKGRHWCSLQPPGTSVRYNGIIWFWRKHYWYDNVEMFSFDQKNPGISQSSIMYDAEDQLWDGWPDQLNGISEDTAEILFRPEGGA